MTLPLIYALSKSSWLEKRRIIGIIRNKSEDSAKVKEVIEFVKKSGGIDYAKEVMQQYYQKATAILNELPDTNYKTSLADLVRFTIDRKN
jgi:octaprenyl-diphosphate synthase